METVYAESHSELMIRVFIAIKRGYKPIGNSYSNEVGYYQDLKKPNECENENKRR